MLTLLADWAGGRSIRHHVVIAAHVDKCREEEEAEEEEKEEGEGARCDVRTYTCTCTCHADVRARAMNCVALCLVLLTNKGDELITHVLEDGGLRALQVCKLVA